MRRLPLNESSFTKIRTNNLIYVDKTRYILALLNTTTFAFLSRPRRFGKSLTVSTLAALFQGQKELFKDLYIYDKWEFKKYPLLWFDFSGIANETPQLLKAGLNRKLQEYALEHEINILEGEPKNKLADLIKGLARKYNHPVVLLIDEYDKSILDHLGQGGERFQIALQNRNILRSFFGILKEGSLQTYIKFVFVTGISTFSKVSIFSEWNQLTDISLKKNFATFLGYTQEELELYFHDHIQNMAANINKTYNQALELLKQWYNGYCFSFYNLDRVYNPISILNTLDEGNIQNYWFATGTPSYLINLLKEKTDVILNLNNLEVAPEFISIYDLEHLPLEAVFYQSGYLTIKQVKEEPINKLILGYPNREVYLSFTRVLLSTLYQTRNQGINEASYLVEALLANNFQQAQIHIDNLLSLVPHRLWKKIADDESNKDKIITEERFYQTIIYLALYASGYMAKVEVISIGGFADLVLEYKDKVFIFEIKVRGTAKIALKQIKDKGYDRKYIDAKEIYLVGMVMDTERRGVKEMEVEILR